MTSFEETLQSFAGQSCGDPFTGPDPVNAAMIRHWCEAMGHPVPDDDRAPEAMLQVWGMRPFAEQGAPWPPGHPFGDLMRHLNREGFASVVATDSDQEFLAPVRIGDVISTSQIIESISEQKRTALGIGYFVTTTTTYRNQRDEVVGTQRFRVLKFAPGGSAALPPPRPRPAITRDNAFWFEAVKEHRLTIQRCTSCGSLRHPPGPACPACRSFKWDTVDACGRATLHSFVVNHHPQVPAFEYPLLVGLVDLEEGTRLVSNLVEVEADEVTIGMALEVVFVAVDDELTLPMFRPAGSGG